MPNPNDKLAEGTPIGTDEQGAPIYEAKQPTASDAARILDEAFARIGAMGFKLMSYGQEPPLDSLSYGHENLDCYYSGWIQRK